MFSSDGRNSQWREGCHRNSKKNSVWYRRDAVIVVDFGAFRRVYAWKDLNHSHFIGGIHFMDIAERNV